MMREEKAERVDVGKKRFPNIRDGVSATKTEGFLA